MINIILPVFNGEETIGRAIKSVIEQTYHDWELIVVNDGSTDDTVSVIESFHDKRIKLYSKENEGIALTRQYGINCCTRDYVTFLDSDDWYEKDFLECMYNEICSTQSDMVVCDFFFSYEDGREIEHKSASFYNKSIHNDKSLLVSLAPQHWNKIYRRTKLQSNKIKYLPGLVYEDLYYSSCLLSELTKVEKVDKCLVHYFQLDDSIMGNTRKLKPSLLQIKPIILAILNYYKNENLYEQFYDELEALAAIHIRSIIDFIFMKKNVSKNERIKYLEDLLALLNFQFKKWNQNRYYLQQFQSYGYIYKAKRRLVDYLLLSNKCDILLKYFIKEE